MNLSPPFPRVGDHPTPRQLDVLKLIATTTPPPTFRELGEALGLCRTTVAGHVAELVRKRLVRRYKPRLAHQLKPTRRGVRLLRHARKRSAQMTQLLAKVRARQSVSDRHALLLADIEQRRNAIAARLPPAPPPFPEVA